jgi:glucans biosynthesis protein C
MSGRSAPSPVDHAGSRMASVDNLKVLLVAGVIVAHATMAWTGLRTWVFTVPPVRQPPLVVAMPLWLLDVFRRRLDRQGRLVRECGRGAFAAFVVHQVVLVGLVLGSRLVPWPPEAKLAAVAVLVVAISFGLGALLVRVPGVSRIV